MYRCGDLADETCTLYIMALHKSLMLDWIEALRKGGLFYLLFLVVLMHSGREYNHSYAT